MVIVFFVLAGLAAAVFLAAGLTKLVRPIPALKAAGMGWVDDVPALSVRLIALAEVLGAIGLIVPMATGIAPILSPIAGLALAVVMVGAVIVHARLKEPLGLQIGLTVLALAAAVVGFLVL
ncbi:DoxX family protein [Rathayibacter sp. VKM Ac-2759]|uniref:DoxX family protein n=1 Tax=Rathayibacter sp. VKM Ac-2759 TaxID=2609252 RepID=UPI001318AF5B|nr:DoxX family protein [Rathayibacter sp. VKM Ac-2759]QHC65535.1 DoxX family protein [Rathayibacter sp. VKM Ac-2759]